MKNLRIMLCGGGTGGHVLPLVAVARAIKNLIQLPKYTLLAQKNSL